MSVCPECREHKKVKVTVNTRGEENLWFYECRACGNNWQERTPIKRD